MLVWFVLGVNFSSVPCAVLSTTIFKIVCATWQNFPILHLWHPLSDMPILLMKKSYLMFSFRNRSQNYCTNQRSPASSPKNYLWNSPLSMISWFNLPNISGSVLLPILFLIQLTSQQLVIRPFLQLGDTLLILNSGGTFTGPLKSNPRH